MSENQNNHNDQSIGDQIRGIVEDALKGAMGGVGDAVKGAVQGVGSSFRSMFSSTPGDPDIIDEPKASPKTLAEVDEGNVVKDSYSPRHTSTSSYINAKFRPPQLYKNAGSELSSANRETVGGGIVTGIGGTVAAGNILAMALGSYTGPSPVFFAILGTAAAALGISMLVRGLQKKGRAGRFSEYLSALGEKTMIKLEDLAYSAGRSLNFIKKDVQDMMNRRMFQQGHFSNVDGDMYLITADQTYRNLLEYKEYSENKARNERIAAEEKEQTERQVEEQLRESGLTTAGIQIVMEGRRHLEDIERLNAEIPDPVITEKLQRMAVLVRELLNAVMKNPGKAGDLRKVMNYYLPTAKNLLNTYIEIEKSGKKTEESLKTQEDISATLDKLNSSFDNLLKQIRTHEKWNVNAEIRVLNSMLEMEGFQEDPITKPHTRKDNKEMTQ